MSDSPADNLICGTHRNSLRKFSLKVSSTPRFEVYRGNTTLPSRAHSNFSPPCARAIDLTFATLTESVIKLPIARSPGGFNFASLKFRICTVAPLATEAFSRRLLGKCRRGRTAYVAKTETSKPHIASVQRRSLIDHQANSSNILM